MFIYRGEADISDLVELFEPLHNHFSDFRRLNLAFHRIQQLLLYISRKIFGLLQGNGPFSAGLHDAVDHLVPVVDLSGAVFLDHHQRRVFDFFIRRKAGITFYAFSSSSDRASFFRRPGIDYPVFHMAAKWAFHKCNTP